MHYFIIQDPNNPLDFYVHREDDTPREPFDGPMTEEEAIILTENCNATPEPDNFEFDHFTPIELVDDYAINPAAYDSDFIPLT